MARTLEVAVIEWQCMNYIVAVQSDVYGPRMKRMPLRDVVGSADFVARTEGLRALVIESAVR